MPREVDVEIDGITFKAQIATEDELYETLSGMGPVFKGFDEIPTLSEWSERFMVMAVRVWPHLPPNWLLMVDPYTEPEVGNPVLYETEEGVYYGRLVGHVLRGEETLIVFKPIDTRDRPSHLVSSEALRIRGVVKQFDTRQFKDL